ncbi:MAG: aldose 1-epimerase family protein [Lachnospiraceae bacterium]|nr:aldose 1-epimerase family protein [Lachnospiraceae bacterium]
MQHIIENDKLKVVVADHGAEIRSIVRKRDGLEMMWQADAAYWGRTSPVLFPLVGNYFRKTSVYKGISYEMGQHGFARDMDFTCVNENENSLEFLLQDDEDTHKKYPFAFRLTIEYILEADTVKVLWKVENINDEKMYFSIGAHPAFNCDLNTYSLRFELNDKSCQELEANVIANDGSGCLSNDIDKYDLDDGILDMSDELFAKDALIIENSQANKVTLINENGEDVVAVSFSTPLFGIWSPVGKEAPFVCIEPWYGRCDRVGFGQDLTQREYGNILDVDEVFRGEYSMKFNL